MGRVRGTDSAKAFMGDVTERYCSKCGTTVPDEAQFCIECGAQVPSRPKGGADRPTQVDERGAGRLALLETLRQTTRGVYDVISEAGHGGMASVFLAHDVALDRKVAIKVFTPDMVGLGETIRERFQREARTAASLSHPHIIPIYAVQQSARILYFVMKYVEGRSLESVLRDEGSLPVPMVMTLLTQVGSALDYAHRKGVIHRDIKPGNIMLDREGYAVVTDFGIAKVAESEGLTLTGSTVGTPAYMSPEQCMGMAVSGASDQYAMGVVTYQMLTGSLPFEAESAMTVMYKHTHEPPRHIADLSDEVPRPLANAVMRMLAKAPDDRFPNMASVMETFGTLHEDEGEMRTQMISLARSKEVDAHAAPGTKTNAGHHATTEPEFNADSLTSKLKSTPVTPIPEAKPKRKKKVVWLLPTAAVTAAFLWFVGPFAQRSGTEVEPDATQTTPEEGSSATTPDLSSVPVQPAVADLDIEPLFATLQVGETAAFRAQAIDSLGKPVDHAALTWESRDEEVVAVGTNGSITALAPGTTSVVVRVLGHSTTIPVIVEIPPTRTVPTRVTRQRAEVANVTVTPDAPTLFPGSSVALEVIARDADGRVLTGRTTQWRSSDVSVVDVSNGILTARQSGSAVITVVVEDRAASIAVAVTDRPVARLSLSQSDARLKPGETVAVRARAFDSDGNQLDRMPTWRSDNPSIASVAQNGSVTAVSQGSTRIWVERDGQSASMSVTVTAAADAVPLPDPEVDQAQIADVIGAYGTAIESNSISAIRRVFPQVPQETIERFEGFFSTVSDLIVTLTIRDLQLNGDAATASADGRYAFRLDGSSRETEFTIQIRLARAGDSWQITDVQ